MCNPRGSISGSRVYNVAQKSGCNHALLSTRRLQGVVDGLGDGLRVGLLVGLRVSLLVGLRVGLRVGLLVVVVVVVVPCSYRRSRPRRWVPSVGTSSEWPSPSTMDAAAAAAVDDATKARTRQARGQSLGGEEATRDDGIAPPTSPNSKPCPRWRAARWRIVRRVVRKNYDKSWDGGESARHRKKR